jgi:hypothetical protein
MLTISFLWYWGLNKGLCVCEVDTLTLESVLFALVILESLTICPGWPGLQSSYFMLPAITGMMCTIIIEMGSHKPFCLGWLRTVIILISPSSIAGDDRHMPPCPVISVEMGSCELPAWAGLEW